MTDTQIEALAADSEGEELAQVHDKIANLEVALKSRGRIGMAIGIPMAQLKTSDEQAFDMTRTVSQTQNRKLRDLAEDVISIGTLDPW